MNSLIIHLLDSFRAIVKVSKGGFVGQPSAQHTKNVECCSSELAVVLANGHEAVCDHCNIYLYPHGILAAFPKGMYSDSLHYPPEEQFHLPYLFVEYYNILSLACKVIGNKYVRLAQSRSIVNYPPQLRLVLGLCLLAS